MKRPGLTVEDIYGKNFDANHLSIAWDSSYKAYVISFICSGGLEIMPVSMIKEIQFSKEGADYCNECDGLVPQRG